MECEHPNIVNYGEFARTTTLIDGDNITHNPIEGEYVTIQECEDCKETFKEFYTRQKEQAKQREKDRYTTFKEYYTDGGSLVEKTSKGWYYAGTSITTKALDAKLKANGETLHEEASNILKTLAHNNAK